MFTFEIDSENALVGCTLEHWRDTIFSFQTSEDLKSIQILVAAICYWSILNFSQSNRKMRSGMACTGRRPAYLSNSVNSVSLVLLDLLSSRRWFTPLGSKNSHFFKWLFTKMAVSMVSGWESEQGLEESHLMLKNAWLCFRISSSFVGNNPSLQIHSFSKDRGKCNTTVNPSMSDFSTILTSYNRILADSSHLPSDEAYRQHLSVVLLGGNVSILSHDICTLISDHDPAHTIHYFWLSLPCRFQARYSFPSYLLIPASELSGDRWVHSY